MAEFTLLKIQLDDSSFTANAPFSGGEETTDTDASEGDTASSGGGAGRFLAAVIGLVVLAVVAVLVKRKLGGDGPDAEELVELDDIEA